jgi:hypothetical protein
MAKAKISEEDKLQTQLLEALRKAIDGIPHRLQGSAKAPGLFPGGQAGAKLIHRARAEGLLQEVPSPEPPPGGKSKAKPPVYVTLTDRGRQLVFDQDSPAKLLAGLHERLDTQGAALAAGMQDVQAQLSACRESVDQFEKRLGTHFAHFQQTAQALRSALDRVPRQPAPSPPQAIPRPAIASAGWLDGVVSFVAAQKRLNSFDRPNLKRVYEHLKQAHPALTLGEFHEGLRALHQQRRIRLEPYTQALATLQDPLHALYLDREVKYYVDLP